MKAILIISHGSKNEEAKQEIDACVASVREQSDVAFLESAFLEINKPNIAQGIENCVTKGAAEILVILNFLNAGRHVKEHIPAIIEEAQEKHPNVRITVGPHLAATGQLENIFLEQINKRAQ